MKRLSFAKYSSNYDDYTGNYSGYNGSEDFEFSEPNIQNSSWQDSVGRQIDRSAMNKISSFSDDLKSFLRELENYTDCFCPKEAFYESKEKDISDCWVKE